VKFNSENSKILKILIQTINMTTHYHSWVGWATGLSLPTNPPFFTTQLLVTPPLVNMVKR